MPKIESVSAYARSLGKGGFWYASWHEHGKRVIRPSGLEYNAKRKDGGKGAAIEIGHSIRDERAQKKDAPAPTFAVRRALLRSGRHVLEETGRQGQADKRTLSEQPAVDDRQVRNPALGRDTARFFQRCGSRDLAR
jgi:hypothetical protein